MSEESQKWYHATVPVFNSGFEDDEFCTYGQDGFNELLFSALGADVTLYDKRIAAPARPARAIVQQRTSDTFNGADDRQVLCPIGTLHCGQYMKYNGGWWLVAGMPDDNRIYEKAVCWKCKHSIRFLSPLTGEIVEYPVYSENSTQYGTGEAKKNQMVVGEDQHLVYLPFNEETILIEDRFRFIMDKNLARPSVFRVTRVDPVSYAVGDERREDGLIQWSVLEDQFNEATDSAELLVADYHVQPPGSSEGNKRGGASLTLTDLDGDFELALGETKKIAVSLTDRAGNPVEPPEYRLTYDFGGAAEVTEDREGAVTLLAAKDPRYVGKRVKLRADNDALGVFAEITIQIVNF